MDNVIAKFSAKAEFTQKTESCVKQKKASQNSFFTENIEN